MPIEVSVLGPMYAHFLLILTTHRQIFCACIPVPYLWGNFEYNIRRRTRHFYVIALTRLSLPNLDAEAKELIKCLPEEGD